MMNPVLRRIAIVVCLSALGLTAVIALAASLGQAEVALTRITYSSAGARRSIQPSISCDGGRIAFISDSDFHNEGLNLHDYYLWLYDAQTTALTRLTPHTSSRNFSDWPSISADGAKIAFYSDTDFLNQGIIDGQYEIWLATTNPLTVTRLTTSTSSVFIHNQQPSISADGTKVAFSSNYDFFGGVLLQGRDLWMVDVATRELTRLVHSVPEGRHSYQPDLSADGTRVVFRSDADFLGQGVPSGSHHIWLYDTLALTFTHISRDITYGGASDWPSISGDGSRIAFVSSGDYLNGGSGGPSHLWLYDGVAQTYTRVTDHPNWPSGGVPVQDPEISLDGNSILFSSTYDHINEQLGDHREIWRYDIPSMTFSRVTTSTGLPFSGMLVTNLASSTNGNGGVLAFESNVDFFNEGDTGEYEIWRAIITPTAGISPPLTYSNTSYLPLVLGSAGGSPPVVWEDDNFDAMSPGQLDGQNGWFRAAPDRASPVVSPSAGGGNFLLIDAGPDQTIVMGKDVPDQFDGQHSLSVHVLVEAEHPGCAFFDSLAKIEVGTVRNNGWDKKFQLYFGSRTMRFNYGPTLRDAVSIVPQTRLGHWYSIRVDFNIITNRADVWVDGALAAHDVPIHPGPIVDLGLSGWDLPGYVQLDDLRGMRK